MKFGKVDSVKGIDLSLPEDHFATKEVIKKADYKGKPNIYVGCAKWNRKDLQNFYPKGTKDELAYYATQFNCIEMNTSFYRIWPGEQFEKWAAKTPENFRFFPKVFQGISHRKTLEDEYGYIDEYCESVRHLGKKLGMCFIQMNEYVKPDQHTIQKLEQFLTNWPADVPLAMEMRHSDWYNNSATADHYYSLLKQHNIANVITDTAGRRDLLHMRLTTNTAFVRYVGSNHQSDYKRVEDWSDRFKKWVNSGLKNGCFFVHQNNEIESVNISRHFIHMLNEALGTALKPPKVLPEQDELF